jgi:hypothetical protein
MNELTYKQEYEVPVELVVNSYKCEYHGCGSHQMFLTTEMSLEEVQNLYDKIKKVPGLLLTNASSGA